MKTSGFVIFIVVVLGALAILASFAAGLALLDIARDKEPSLVLEWTTVWIALVVVVIAQAVSIAIIVSLWRQRGREQPTG